MTPTVLIIIVISVCILIIGILISKYNSLSRNRNQIENSISSLDAIFIKRADLIPNLVDVVKQYMNFEDSTLTKIIALRTTSATSSAESEESGNQAMKNLMIQVENYPELKANTQFTNLQYSWNEIEEQISAGRRYISASVTGYNNSVTTFPSNIVSKLYGFKYYDWQYATNQQKKSLDSASLFK